MPLKFEIINSLFTFFAEVVGLLTAPTSSGEGPGDDVKT